MKTAVVIGAGASGMMAALSAAENKDIRVILLERQPVLVSSEWTLYAAIPTIVYWTVYLILTATNLWKDPYGFSQPGEKSGTVISVIAGIAMFALIPAMSIGLDYLLWWLNTLNI